MTGYHARWNTAGIERSRVRTFARTLMPADGPSSVAPPCPSEQPLPRVIAPHTWFSPGGDSHGLSPHHTDLFASIRAALQDLPSTAQPAVRTEPTLKPSSVDYEPPPQPPCDDDAASSRPSFDASSGPERHRERAAVSGDVPADFSDLVALGGPAPLDGDYHDFPAALDAAVPNHRGRPDGSSALRLDNEAADPLLELAAEYERALLHDTSGVRHELKAGVTDRPLSPALPGDPFADPHLAPANQSLVDLLVVGQNIDTILDGLDSFGAERLFEDEKRAEILSLLAPQNAQRPMPPRVSLSARLAREEHHQISVDSHIDVLATQSDAPPSDPAHPDHEDHR